MVDAHVPGANLCETEEIILASARTFIIRAVRLLIYVFAAIGFLDLLGRGVVLPFSGMIFGYVVRLPHDYDVQKVVLSPDRSLKAVVYVRSGPAFDAGCNKMVAVVDRWESTNIAWRDANIVYRAECDMLGRISWEPPADGRVRPRLRIEADPGKADYMSRLAIGGTVAVAFPNDH